MMRRTVAVVVALGAAAGMAAVQTDAFASCTTLECRTDRLHGRFGGAAIDALGPRVAATAAANGWSEAKLRHELLSDGTLGLDAASLLYYADVAAGDAVTVASTTESLPLAPAADVFALHSLPGAPLVIYLDVDGHTTTGTSWNSSYGSTITSGPFDLDGAPSTFSATERDRIQRWWLRVAEDFAPFQVDVTTQDPGVEALRKTNSTDANYGTRVVISPTNWYSTGAGGVAYLNSFTWGTDTPAFVFTGQLGNGDEKYVAEAASHEAGHTFGLSHDGDSSTSYYSGNGVWAPIMGVGYYAPLAQWSKGTYPGANNTENDLATITGKAPLQADDAGDTQVSAKLVTPDFTVSGMISTAADRDVYTLSTDGGRLSATVRPAYAANTDTQLVLLDSAGKVLAAADPPGAAAASISLVVPAGVYSWVVDGVGMADQTYGYDDWASIGRYQLTGVLDSPSTPASMKSVPVPAPAVSPISPVVGEPVTFDAGYSYDPDGGAVTQYSWAFTSTSPSSDSAAVATRAFTTAGRYTFRLAVLDDEGVTGSVTLTIVVRPAASTTTATTAAATTTTAVTTTTAAPTTTTIAPTTTTIAATTTTAAATTTTIATRTVHVASVKVRTAATGTVVADITLVASDGTPVAGATVTGKWSGLLKGSATATTGANGVGTTPASKIRKGGTATFTVTAMTLPPGYRWDGVAVAGGTTI